MSVLRQAAILAAALALAGCGVFDRAPPEPCPRISILRDASRIVEFRPGAGRDLVDVVLRGEIANVAANCTVSPEGIEVRSTIQVTVERGPAAQDPNGEVTFFVAVVDSQDEILAKETFGSPFAFAPGQRQAAAVEKIEQIIPRRAGVAPDAYTVLVGFQLSRDQLEYNRGQQR